MKCFNQEEGGWIVSIYVVDESEQGAREQVNRLSNNAFKDDIEEIRKVDY
jgi:capsular polysaccharide biosynthesis protein